MNEGAATTEPITREELFELAWKESMLRLGERFGVSSSYMARVCTELRVPRPPRGYWSQLEFGKAPPKPALPAARPGDVTTCRPGSTLATSWPPARAGTSPVEPTPRRRKAPRVERHELLVGVKPFFLKSRKTEHGLLRPFKRMLVDIIASEEQLDAALDAANVLFLALEAQGHRVALAPVNTGLRRPQVDEREASRKHDQYHPSPWAPDRATVVYIAAVPIGLTLFEMTEEVEMMYVRGDYVPVKTLSATQLRMYRGPAHWTTHKPRPSGRFCLQAYCADPLVQWRKQWRVASGPALGALVPAVVSELEAEGPSLADQLVEAAARAEARRREWEAEVRRHEEERKRALQRHAIRRAQTC